MPCGKSRCLYDYSDIIFYNFCMISSILIKYKIICTQLYGFKYSYEILIIIWLFGGDRGVIVIVVGNEHGDTSSNPGRD